MSQNTLKCSLSLSSAVIVLIQLILHCTVWNSRNQQYYSLYYALYVNAPRNIKSTIGLKSQNPNPLIAWFLLAVGKRHISIFKQMVFMLKSARVWQDTISMAHVSHCGFENHS